MPALVYPFVVVGLVLMVFLPKLTTTVPAPLVAIVALTAAAVVLSVDIPNVGDEGQLPSSLPTALVPDVPLTGGTLSIIAPYALAVALVGRLESLLTAKLVDDITDTHSNKTREGWGQGVANEACQQAGLDSVGDGVAVDEAPVGLGGGYGELACQPETEAFGRCSQPSEVAATVQEVVDELSAPGFPPGA